MWRNARPACLRLAVAFLFVCGLGPGAVHGAKVTMRDGRVLEGKIHPIRSMSVDPSQVHDGPTPIVVLTDDLRRYFLPKRRIDAPPVEGAGEVMERFRVWQPTSGGGAPIVSVGPIIKIEKFTEHGRRKLVMNSLQGPKDIIQGITEITPVYTKVTTLKDYKWDMRIATSSIPRETLNKILFNDFNVLCDTDDKEYRLRVVRFYLQAERFEDAQAELDRLLKDAPEIRPQYQRTLRNIQQLSARRLLNEVRTLERAGRTKLVWGILNNFLNNFPAESVAGETLQEVQEMLAAQRSLHEQGRAVLARLDAHINEIADEALREQLAPIRQEIINELTVHTLDRMATYQQLADGSEQTVNEKVAFAVSGWLLGPKDGTGNLAVALSLYRVRDLIREYCNTDNQIERDQILSKISSQEGGTPLYVAKLIAHMKPPKTTEPQEGGPVGHYRLTVDGLRGGAPVTYYVQLPPEYDPYRRYPTVVTLRGAGSTVKQQVDWWAGNIDEKGNRQGQGARHGYIVIAPEWAKPHQNEYEYTLREHVAVLNSLRDACRRFAVDTDRVFLSGHSMGGDAAWDLGLAHPDLWAGVIPIVARCDKYCDRYWENAEYVPIYSVRGELDATRSVKNAMSLDRYMTGGFPITVCEFLGRGHEHFSDEIHNIFDWMSRYRRNFFPSEFECTTMRPWDNYFWWLEVDGLPEKGMVEPHEWPKRGVRAPTVRGKLLANNNVSVNAGARQVTLWLSPEAVDFRYPVRIVVNGKTHNIRDAIQSPDLRVLLEDVRTRGDRQHAFWVKITLPGGRR